MQDYNQHQLGIASTSSPSANVIGEYVTQTDSVTVQMDMMLLIL